MITKRISLREDNPAVFLDLYLLDNSLEFQTDQPRPAVIVCPGGGYLFTSDREAEPIALRFLAQGYHVFVLRYSVQTPFPQPMIDLAKSILLVRQNATEWLVNPDQIAICGFSAGGHLAASSGVLWNQPWFYESLGVAPADSWGYFVHDTRFRLFFQPVQQTLCLFDQVGNVAFYWVGDAQQLALADGGAPLLTLWHWWAGQQQCQVVHGAAIGIATGGALLIGKSGSGKSTTALAALAAGLWYVGDDYCLVRPDAEPLVYSLFSSGKVHFADLTRFPCLQAARTALPYANADKALFFFAELFAHTIAPALPLKMIVLPVISAQTHASLCAISPAQALLALAPSTLFQLERSLAMWNV